MSLHKSLLVFARQCCFASTLTLHPSTPPPSIPTNHLIKTLQLKSQPQPCPIGSIVFNRSQPVHDYMSLWAGQDTLAVFTSFATDCHCTCTSGGLTRLRTKCAQLVHVHGAAGETSRWIRSAPSWTRSRRGVSEHSLDMRDIGLVYRGERGKISVPQNFRLLEDGQGHRLLRSPLHHGKLRRCRSVTRGWPWEKGEQANRRCLSLWTPGQPVDAFLWHYPAADLTAKPTGQRLQTENYCPSLSCNRKVGQQLTNECSARFCRASILQNFSSAILFLFVMRHSLR